MSNNITLLKRHEINENRWEELIDETANSLPYFQTWYLDRVSPGWSAFIKDDYRYIMPLTKNRKLGFSYLRQPLYCQQLGILPAPDNETGLSFIKEIQKHFAFAEINFKAGFKPVLAAGSFSARHNFLLPLHREYNQISKDYSQHNRRKLKKAEQNELLLNNNLALEEFAKFKIENLNVKQSQRDLNRLFSLVEYALDKKVGKIYGAQTYQNELGAAAFFIRHKNRIIYLNAASSKTGRDNQAMFFLIDRFIREHAGQDLTLDFEGSMVPGVARLYKGFGARPETYYHFKWNNLPWWIKWMKK